MNTNSSYNPFLSAFLQLITPEAGEWYGRQLKFFAFFVASLINKSFQLVLHILRYKTMQPCDSRRLIQQNQKLELPTHTNVAEPVQSIDTHLECEQTHVDEEIACPSLVTHDASELEEEFPDTWG